MKVYWVSKWRGIEVEGSNEAYWPTVSKQQSHD